MPLQYKFDPDTYSGLDKLGRIPLSRSFHFREFLYSEIAAQFGIKNIPTDIDAAVHAGSQLCQLLLEPLQNTFGRVHVRSGYRSPTVNQKGVGKYNCAEDNDGAHTWDFVDRSGHGAGAMACISVPYLSEMVLSGEADVADIAWWIVDHLPAWSVIEFFSTPSKEIPFANEVAFNIGWHEKPKHLITSWRGGERNLHNAIPTPGGREIAWKKLMSRL